MNTLIGNIKNYHHILILGFGREGKSTYNVIRHHFPDKQLTIADKNEGILKFSPFLSDDANINFRLGKSYLENIQDNDLIFKSPGINLDKIKGAGKLNITSQTDQLLKHFNHQVIGITGTKGKSTTASLIHHILSTNNKDSLLIGNIGIPPFDGLKKIKKDTSIIFELSSHQLTGIKNSPGIAILLNLFPEHLDHYATTGEYFSSKFNIFNFQDSSDYFIFNKDDSNIFNHLNNIKASGQKISITLTGSSKNTYSIQDKQVIYFDNELKKNQLFQINDTLSLKGKHNLTNILAAIAAARLKGISDEGIRKALTSFMPLEHRLEYVGKFGGIHFYNDSIATIPEATIAAVNTLGDINTLILGGYDRDLDYSVLIRFILEKQIPNLILTGKVGQRLQFILSGIDTGKINIHFTSSWNNMAELIRENTAPNGICLLSPAAASYDVFKSFEERGELFKKIARSI